MSFGQEIRQELLETLPQSACCRRSLLHGLLINAENGVAGMVMCRIPDICAAESARKLLLEQYDANPIRRLKTATEERSRYLSLNQRDLQVFLERFPTR